ncbi:MAG: cryptochrome/photolyase family protein [Actinomycetota bacterium]
MRALVLFTRDLRVHDHPALSDACRTADEVIPLFVRDTALAHLSPNRSRFLEDCLVDLHRSLGARGGRLVLRNGDPVRESMALAQLTGCETIHLTKDASSYAVLRERRLSRLADLAGVRLRFSPGHAVVEPGAVSTSSGNAYRVFTPYHRAWEAAGRRTVLPAPAHLAVPDDVPPDPPPDPGIVTQDAPDLPRGGESTGRRQLARFLRTELADYDAARNVPAADATSRLSPYLRFGCVSATEVVERACENGGSGAAAFVRQLAWRDFYLQLLAGDPRLARHDLRPGSEHDEARDPVDLEAWRQGRTGLPLVDAGMRQLLREGWMHNRVRMVVANLLTRRLGFPWQDGAAHFARHLVDGDPANNAGGWQWVAGTGTDPRRARTFNPVLQAQRFDPDGAYIRRYVLELREVAPPLVFAPWIDPDTLRRTGYPAPTVDVRVSSSPSTTSAPASTSLPR